MDILPESRRIPVFTDDPGWHGKALQRAFAARGFEAVFVSLRDCAFDFSGIAPRILIPGFEAGLPAGAFVRGVPGGTLQQVIMRLDILHALRLLGVHIYNDGRAIERTVDKAMTSLHLLLDKLPTPATWVCESRQQAQGVLAREALAGRPLVIKPVFGSQGQGVRRLEPGMPLPVPMEAHVDGLYYLQQYVDSGEGAWHDYRVFVIAGQAVAAMKRYGSQWVNNVAQGGRCEATATDDVVAKLAIAAAKAVAIDYCGVDIIRDREGRPYVLEVNSIPAWRGLQGATQVDIAQLLVDDFIARMQSGQRLAAVSA